jgi:biotin transport system substrate-specific component
MDASNDLRMTVLAALFAALIAVGAFIAIPIGPVPIVMQNFFVLLCGLLLGPRWGLAACGVYLLAGGLGLPVFAGGTGGLGRFFGPTGGYLLAYLPAVFLTGWISGNKKHAMVWDSIAMILATAVIYSLGVSWLKISTGMAWPKAIAVGMLPFLLGDALKIVAAVVVARAARPMIGHYTKTDQLHLQGKAGQAGYEHH